MPCFCNPSGSKVNFVARHLFHLVRTNKQRVLQPSLVFSVARETTLAVVSQQKRDQIQADHVTYVALNCFTITYTAERIVSCVCFRGGECGRASVSEDCGGHGTSRAGGQTHLSHGGEPREIILTKLAAGCVKE